MTTQVINKLRALSAAGFILPPVLGAQPWHSGLVLTAAHSATLVESRSRAGCLMDTVTAQEHAG